MAIPVSYSLEVRHGQSHACLMHDVIILCHGQRFAVTVYAESQEHTAKVCFEAVEVAYIAVNQCLARHGYQLAGYPDFTEKE